MKPKLHTKLKIGLIGVGNLAMQYLIRLQQNEQFKLLGFYDENHEAYEYLEDDYNLPYYAKVKTLIDESDALLICTPNQSIMKYLHVAIKTGKHIFLGRPLTHDLQEILYIQDLVKESDIKMQISLPDTFNPIFGKLKENILEPIFVEMKRNINFEFSKTNPHIIHEFLLKDVCLLLNLTTGITQKIRFSNAFKQHDFIQLRVEFDNGTSAHLSINKISNLKNFNVQIYQTSKTINANFPERTIHTLTQDKDHIIETNTEVDEVDAINEELNAFAKSIINNQEAVNSIADFYKSSELVNKILKQMPDNKTINLISTLSY